MAWSYVGGQIETSTTNTPPVGATAGNLLLCYALNATSSAVLTPPSGWTEIQSDPGAADFAGRLFYRVMQAADTSWTWTWTTGIQQQTTYAVGGNATTSPVDVSSATQGAAINTLATASVTPTVANTLFVGVWGCDAATRTWTQDASLTERIDGNGGTTLDVCVATEELSGTSALTRSATVSGTAQDLSAFAVVVKPAAGAVTGVATANLTLSATASGVRTVNGQAASALSLAATASGVRTVPGTASSALTFAATAAGTVSGANQVSGVATANLTFTATASGVRTVLGQASAPFSLTAAAAGVRTVLGAATAVFAFTATAADSRSVGAGVRIVSSTPRGRTIATTPRRIVHTTPRGRQ